MKNKTKICAIAVLICLAFIPSSVFAFGEVAGPVVINVPIGGSGVGTWGLGHNETVNVKLRVEGNASKYLSLPSEITLPPNGIYWINVTATIPSDYNVTQGTNITGVMYATLEGLPGQVQINLQLMKNVLIVVEQPQASSSATESPVGKFITGLFALEPTSVISVLGLIFIISIASFYFVKRKRR